MFDAPPSDRLVELGTTYADQVHVNPLAAFWYAPMNTNLAPFDDVRVRQAVNYAIDRDALVGLFGGDVLAQPVCQILPPEFPGHVDNCIYTEDPGPDWIAPDMEKAKALVAESGTAGEKVTVIVEDNATARAIGTYLQSVLAELGYDSTVKAISPNIQFTLHPEHRQQGADLGVAVVHGLPGGFELPQRPFVLRLVHAGQRRLDQHCRLLQ